MIKRGKLHLYKFAKFKHVQVFFFIVSVFKLTFCSFLYHQYGSDVHSAPNLGGFWLIASCYYSLSIHSLYIGVRTHWYVRSYSLLVLSFLRSVREQYSGKDADLEKKVKEKGARIFFAIIVKYLSILCIRLGFHSAFEFIFFIRFVRGGHVVTSYTEHEPYRAGFAGFIFHSWMKRWYLRFFLLTFSVSAG